MHFLLRSLHEDPGYAQTNVHYFTGDWGEFVLPSLWRESVNDSKVESFKVLHKRRQVILQRQLQIIRRRYLTITQ